jgi:hypothetical protein
LRVSLGRSGWLLGSRTSVRVAGVVRAEGAETRTLWALLRLAASRIDPTLPVARIRVAGVVRTKTVETWPRRVLLRLVSARIRSSLPGSRISAAGVVGTKAVETWPRRVLLRLIATQGCATVDATLHVFALG